MSQDDSERHGATLHRFKLLRDRCSDEFPGIPGETIPRVDFSYPLLRHRLRRLPIRKSIDIPYLGPPGTKIDREDV